MNSEWVRAKHMIKILSTSLFNEMNENDKRWLIELRDAHKKFGLSNSQFQVITNIYNKATEKRADKYLERKQQSYQRPAFVPKVIIRRTAT